MLASDGSVGFGPTAPPTGLAPVGAPLALRARGSATEKRFPLLQRRPTRNQLIRRNRVGLAT